MRLFCNRCQRPFNSMFGPPHARCPTCGQTDTRHADGEGVPGGAQVPPLHAPAQDQNPFRAPAQPLPADVQRTSTTAEGLDTRPYLALAIVLMVTCCQPGAVVALYFLDRAKNVARNGDLDAAREKLAYAKVTLLASAVLGALAVFAGVALLLLR